MQNTEYCDAVIISVRCVNVTIHNIHNKWSTAILKTFMSEKAVAYPDLWSVKLRWKVRRFLYLDIRIGLHVVDLRDRPTVMAVVHAVDRLRLNCLACIRPMSAVRASSWVIIIKHTTAVRASPWVVDSHNYYIADRNAYYICLPDYRNIHFDERLNYLRAIKIRQKRIWSWTYYSTAPRPSTAD